MKLQGLALAAFAATGGTGIGALVVPDPNSCSGRRAALGWISGAVVGAAGWTLEGEKAYAVADMPDSFDIDSYLKSGFVQNPMGVSGQAGE